MLVDNISPFNIFPTVDEATSPTPSIGGPSHPPPANNATGMLHVPTADRRDRPAVIDEPEPRKRLEGVIAPEPDPQQASDQVHEPGTQRIVEGVLVELDALEGSPAHTPATVS